jgi:hypothetical protein
MLGQSAALSITCAHFEEARCDQIVVSVITRDILTQCTSTIEGVQDLREAVRILLRQGSSEYMVEVEGDRTGQFRQTATLNEATLK